MSELSPTPTTPRGGPPPTARWGLLDAGVGWILAQFGGLVASLAVFLLSGTSADDFDSLSLGWVALAQLGLWLGLLGVPWVASQLKGSGLVHDFGLRVTGSDVPVGVVWGLVTQLLLIPLVYLPIFLLSDISSEKLAEPARGLTDRATDPLGVVLLVLIVGIGAPIIEEIFYRGLLQRAMIGRFGTWPGLIGTAMLFGAAHLQVLQFPALTLFGIVLGVLALRTGRLGAPIAAHVIFNMITVVTLVGAS